MISVAYKKTYFWHHQLEIENSLIAIRPESCERPNSATKLVGFSTFPLRHLVVPSGKLCCLIEKVQKLELLIGQMISSFVLSACIAAIGFR